MKSKKPITIKPNSSHVKGGIAGGVAALVVASLVQWEGLTHTAKHERIDPPGVITVCYGMTNYDRPLKAGQKFTTAECEEFLLRDIPRYADQARNCIPGLADLPPHRQAAMVSFVYNVGEGTLCRSSVARYMNKGDITKACQSLMLYTKADGKVLRGLINRRKFEKAWCLRND